MMASPTTRYSLLLRIQDPCNQAAWAEFVAIYEPLAYRLARRKGLQDADAQDLCQDVFWAVAGAAKSILHRRCARPSVIEDEELQQVWQETIPLEAPHPSETPGDVPALSHYISDLQQRLQMLEGELHQQSRVARLMPEPQPLESPSY